MELFVKVLESPHMVSNWNSANGVLPMVIEFVIVSEQGCFVQSMK